LIVQAKKGTFLRGEQIVTSCVRLINVTRMDNVDISGEYGLSFILNLIPKGGMSMQAYCVKCRAKKEMKDPKNITMKNGKPATQGTCPTCGTKMFRIGKT